MIARAVLVAAALAVVPLLAACDANTQTPDTCPPSDAVVTVEDLSVGTGQAASPTSTVEVRYIGRRASDGVVFDSSGTGTRTFSLTGVITGFRQGIGGRAASGDTPAIAPMRLNGARRRISVPTLYGYWTQPRGELLPACTDLVFDVELIDLP